MSKSQCALVAIEQPLKKKIVFTVLLRTGLYFSAHTIFMPQPPRKLSLLAHATAFSCVMHINSSIKNAVKPSSVIRSSCLLDFFNTALVMGKIELTAFSSNSIKPE